MPRAAIRLSQRENVPQYGGGTEIDMRILVFSDSHKNTSRCAAVIRNLVGIDMILHAGDHCSDAEELAHEFPEIPMKYVRGNCDFSAAPQELVIEAEGKKILLTHGHAYAVKYECDCRSLLERAKECGCDCAVFGHTHEGLCDASRGVVLLNPGSIKYGGTYGVIEIEDGKLKAAVCDASYLA